MQNFKRIFCLLLPFAFVFYMLFCSRFLDVSADSFVYEKMSLNDTRDLLGTNLNCTFRAQNQDWSGTFRYYGAWSAASSAFRGGWNCDSDIPSYTAMSAYGCCAWILDVSGYNLGSTTYLSLEIPIYIHASGGFRTMFFCSSPQFDGSMNPVNDFNLRALGGNYISASPDSFEACSANYQSAAALADYYGIVSANTADNGYYCEMRPIYVDGENITLETIHFNSLLFQGGKIFLYMLTPYTYGEVVNTRPVTTTTTSGGSALGSYDINVTVDVDLSPVVSEISGVAGEVQRVKDEVTGIATDVSNIGSLLAVDASETAANMSLEPLGTISSIDYDRILDDADEVMEDLPNALVGTASIWAMISALVDTNAIWLWLIPLCMLLCFMSVMLWRS